MNKFEIKDKIDNVMYVVYNMLAESGYFFSFGTKKIIQKNTRFRDIHKGERCFILGTGPSLTQLDDQGIGKLQNEITFGVNFLYKSDIGSRLIPRYYTLVDNEYFSDLSYAFGELISKYHTAPPVFITDFRAKKILDDLHVLNNIYIYAKKYPVKKVDERLDRNSYALMNVVSVSIVSAIYMGFSKIYLLGCDYNAFCNFGYGHCYDDAQEVRADIHNLAYFLKYYHITTEFHYLIAKLAKEKGVEVVNLTESSLLDAYPRQSVLSVL